LQDALLASLDGRPVLLSATGAPGCVLERQLDPHAQPQITYHNQISRLLQRHCVECHREGGVGPFKLDTYDDALAHAPMIGQVVEQGTMPPWFAAPHQDQSRSPWVNDRSLSATEKEQLSAWLTNQMPLGDPNESPLPKTFVDGWLIGKPDAVFEFDKPVAVKATGTMPYQNVWVDTHLDQDRWVQAIEVRPGNSGVVHHVLVFVQETQQSDGPRDDAADERGGYWGIYVPGNSTLVYPEGYAKRIPKGARLRFQMHYTPNGTATEDRTRIGLVFAKEEPKYEVRVAGVVNPGFRIPPGEDNYPVVGSIKNIPADVQVLAFLPHMHLRGKAAKYELISGGNTRTLLDVPRYDFNWQLLYRYAEPLSIKAGDTIQYTAWYDRRGGGGNAGGGREDDSQPVEESEQGRKISAAMMDYWIAFMKDGKPSGKDLPDWPAYQPTEPKVMVFGNESIAAK
jgi:mono/diheme cytochrome c family protein